MQATHVDYPLGDIYKKKGEAFASPCSSMPRGNPTLILGYSFDDDTISTRAACISLCKMLLSGSIYTRLFLKHESWSPAVEGYTRREELRCLPSFFPLWKAGYDVRAGILH
jgi:hypothetical protein